MATDLLSDKPADPPAKAAGARLSVARRVAGGVVLGLCLALSLLLAADQLGQLRLPGCTAQSACQALTAGPWGKIAFGEDASLGWPVSFLGAAYFGGLLAGWLLSPRGGPGAGVTWLARLGLVGSLIFAGIMYWEGTFCGYCAAVHVGNVAFWLIAETTPAAGFRPRPLIAFACTAAVVSAALGWGQARVRQQVAAEANVLLQASIRQVIEVSRRQSEPVADRPAFRGRYGRGPTESAVRLVIFTDYECVHCREWDRQLTQALAAYDTMTFSVKHFPLCPACNPAIPKEQKSHPNACRAAWAAEAAGLLGGREGFWPMHRWLFEQGGKFTDEELTDALGTLGFADAETFLAAMNGEEARANVARDIQEAEQVGVPATPALYANGVPVIGVKSIEALHDMLATLDAAGLPPRTAQFDRPALVADQRYTEWLQQPTVEIPTGKCRWQAGPDDAANRVVVFLDCHQPASAAMAGLAREWAQRGHARAEFYHFPYTVEGHGPHRLVEAAGRVGGQDAFWRMHDWFCEKGADVTAEQGLDAAGSLKLDREKLAAEFERQATTQAVDADIQLGVTCKAGGAPRMFINGRRVHPSASPKDLMERILAAK